MKHDDFEQLMARQPLEPPPASWREQILRTQPASPSPAPTQPGQFRWRDLFWPSPLAWAGVAALWLATFLLDSTGPRVPQTAVLAQNGSPLAVRMVLAEQRVWLDQLLPPPTTPAPTQPRIPAPAPPPRPRSERSRQFIAV